MTQIKSTRAFRTIGEAAEELGLQPHVLRFWESKFSQIQPMKRRGGRRLYRPEDIEFLRGIKILLHREQHPIKDVQKLIQIKGADSIVELGRSTQIAAQPKNIKETDLVPDYIEPAAQSQKPKSEQQTHHGAIGGVPDTSDITLSPFERSPVTKDKESDNSDAIRTRDLNNALEKLRALKSRWEKFK